MTDSPLRTKEQRLQFCEDFFQAVDAPVVYSSEDYREYRLPRDVDKELTDRPYYWLWVEQTGQEVEPTTLRLAFSESALERENQRLHDEAWSKVNPEEMNEIDKMFFRPPTAELVTLGGFRLERIIDAVRSKGAFICARPRSEVKNFPLVPWLLVNVVISYACDLTEQEYASFGLCLTNGQIVEDFWPAISKIPMEGVSEQEILGKQELALTPQAGVAQLEQFLTHKLQSRPHQWAVEAEERLREDLGQLDLYYQSLHGESDDDIAIIETEHERKRRELISRAEPKIQIEIGQLGLIGLMESR